MRKGILAWIQAASKNHDLIGNSIKQKMLLESRALFWNECPAKCLIEINNMGIKNEDACEVMQHFI
jgi:hypothetical protein